MPSTPKPRPENDWPEAPDTPVPQDEAHPHEVGGQPAGIQHAQPNDAPEAEEGAAPQTAPTSPAEGGSSHRPALPPGQIPAAWLPPEQAERPQEQPPAGPYPAYPAAPGVQPPYPPGPSGTGPYPGNPQYPGTPDQDPAGHTPTGPYPVYPQPPGAPGQYPTGQAPTDQYPTGQYPGYPQGPGAPGQYPPGPNAPGAWLQGPYPPGQYPPGQYPPGQQPSGQQFHPGGAQWNLPDRKRKTPEELKASALRTRERRRLFIIMVIGLLVVSQLPLPFRLAGIALGLVAGFVGIRVLIGLAEMRRNGMGAPGVIFTVFGLGLTGMLLLVLVSQAVYYPVVSDLEKCQARANTEAANQACVDESTDRFNNILDGLNRRANAN